MFPASIIAANRRFAIAAPRLATNLTFAEKFLDAVFEVLGAGESDVDRGDFSVLIDQQSCGDCFDSAVGLGDAIIAHQDAIIHLHHAEKGFHIVPAVLVQGDAEHLETAILRLALEARKPRDLHAARAAGGGPEIEQHYFAFVVGEAHSSAVRIFEREIRRGLAMLVVLDGDRPLGDRATRTAGEHARQQQCARGRQTDARDRHGSL